MSTSPESESKGLKVAQLREYLDDHDIEYPLGAKKSELVKLVDGAKNKKPKKKESKKKKEKKKAESPTVIEHFDVSDEEDTTNDFEASISVRKRKAEGDTPVKKRVRSGVVNGHDVSEEATPKPKRKTTPKATPKSAKATPKATPKSAKATPKSIAATPKSIAATPKSAKATPKTAKATPKSESKNITSPVSATASTISGKVSPKTESGSSRISTPHVKAEAEDSGDDAAAFDAELKRIKNETPSKSRLTSGRTSRLSSAKKALSDEEIRRQIDKELAARLQVEVTPSLKPRARKVSQKKKLEPEPSDDESEDDDTEVHEKAAKPRAARRFGAWLVIRALFFAVFWLVTIAGGLFLYWYREQQYLIGYCGREIDTATIPDDGSVPELLVSVGEYLDANFKPGCVPCPPHARCFQNLEIGCYQDFIEYKPWYFDYSPVINRTLKRCVPDTKKAEKLEIMIDVALDLLRSKNADRNCGKTPEDLDEAGISLDELHDLLLSMKAPFITVEEFEELWKRLVVELEKEPEIIVRQVRTGNPPFSDSY